ncbi:MAG: arylamine N-acetyltransferase [Nitrospira sp.]|nr:arylamine N-acetyltransferase [Nitrospira sp.]
MDTSLDIPAYLDRIRVTQAPSVTIEFLRTLHRQHVFHVPFENLDIHLGRTISLAPADLFEKIVRKRRGGYCFELNGLFQLLLQALGFQIYSTAARVLFGTETIPPRSHQLLIVTLDEADWVVDVGFGAFGLIEPIPLTTGLEHRQITDRFRLEQDPLLGFVFQSYHDNRWHNQYAFTPDLHHPIDFAFANYYHSHSPHSIFTQKRLCQLPTTEGRKRLDGKTLLHTVNGTTQPVALDSEQDVLQALKTHFNLHLL